MCSPSNVYQLIATWADIAAVDGIGEGIREIKLQILQFGCIIPA